MLVSSSASPPVTDFATFFFELLSLTLITSKDKSLLQMKVTKQICPYRIILLLLWPRPKYLISSEAIFFILIFNELVIFVIIMCNIENHG